MSPPACTGARAARARRRARTSCAREPHAHARPCCGPCASRSREHSFVEELNLGWQKDFELTPQAIVDHWQPLIIGWIALAHHAQFSRSFQCYGSYLQMSFWYIFLAAFGCFGYAGNLGIIAGSLALFTAGFAIVLAIFGGNREPQLVLF